MAAGKRHKKDNKPRNRRGEGRVICGGEVVKITD